MKYALVKFTVDLYAPDAVISPTLTQWFSKCRDFHSRRTLWPVVPIDELLDPGADGSRVLQDFLHVRVTSMMDEYDGATDGAVDQMLTEKSVDEVFDMPRIASVALDMARPYYLGTTHTAWIELYKFDEASETIKYIEQVSVSLYSPRSP